MARLAKFLTATVAAMSLTGCATLFHSGLDRVERGMTTEQVRKLAGTPVINDFDETAEIWGYRMGVDEYRRIIWLRFVNGRLVSKTTQPWPEMPKNEE